MRGLWLACAALVLALPSLATASAGAAARELPALQLDQGGIARRQLVAIGRDVVVRGEALSHVVAIDGAVRVEGRVAGDVIALGGDVLLAERALVEGDIFVLGGSLEAAPGARVSGRSVTYPGVSGAFLALLEAPALGLDPNSAVVVGVKLALLTGWLAVVVLLFATGGREMLSTSRCVREEPLRAFGIGLTFVLATVVSLVALNLAFAALVGIPFVVLLLLFALVAKLWGTVAVFHALGVVVGSRLGLRRPLPLTAATLGLLLLGGLKFVPYAGLWAWWAVSFVGVGATLVTKFGRREPWLLDAPRALGAFP